MAETERAERARSFGEIADSYHRFRPGPPASAVEWVVPPSCGTALDLGAGTGSLARRLLDRSARVIAVEPDPRMLAVLAAHSPRVAGVQAVAEHLPLATGSVDAVMISSAWHWMDADSTVVEVGRVLHHGGVLGVVWNGPDRSVEWVADLLRRRDAEPGDPDERRPRHRFELPGGSAFAGLETRVLTWSLPMTRDELIGLAGTYSTVITLSSDRRAEELARIEDRVTGSPSLQGRSVVELPMRCRCWRAVRQ
jgi:SAM-dependent methyltransferase